MVPDWWVRRPVLPRRAVSAAVAGWSTRRVALAALSAATRNASRLRYEVISYRVVTCDNEYLTDELPAAVPLWCDCESYFTEVNGVMIRTHLGECVGYSLERCGGCRLSFIVKDRMLNGEGRCPNCAYLGRVGVSKGSIGQGWFYERD